MLSTTSANMGMQSHSLWWHPACHLTLSIVPQTEVTNRLCHQP